MKKIPLRLHLEELQQRLRISAIFFVSGVVIAFLLRRFLLDLVKRPHIWVMDKLHLPSTVYVLNYQDHFISQFKICLVAGFIFSFPLILYQVMRFIGAGLWPKERHLIWTYLFAFLILFTMGTVFSYFVLLPYGLYFLSLYGLQVGLQPFINFGSYVSLFVLLVTLGGISFELPLVMVLLVQLGLVSAEDLGRRRRLAILLIFIIAAILTPPDPVTQLLMAFPMLFLYEAGLFFSKLVERKEIRCCDDKSIA